MVQFIRKLVRRVRKKRASACVIQEIQLEARKQILFFVRGENYLVQAKCSDCGYSFSEFEILKQFKIRSSEFSISMHCSKCACVTIKPSLKVNNIEVNFLSPIVTSVSLTSEMLTFSPEQIRKEYPSIYYSAIFNFGSLKNAFFQVKKRKYRQIEIRDWKARMKDIPIQCTNRMISNVLGIPIAKINEIRG